MNGEKEVKKTTGLNSDTVGSGEMQQETTEAEQITDQVETLSKKHIKLKSIGINAVTLFCRQLATLVDVGIPLLKCLQILHQRTSHPKLQTIIQHLAQDIEQGMAFSASLEKYPHVFSPFFVNMTKVAEKGGSLDEALKVVADVLEKEEIMKQKVRDALVYPFITLFVGVFVIGVLLIGIIPIFGDLYSQQHEIALPLPTKILLALGSPWTLVVLLVLIAAVVYTAYTSGKSSGSKAFYDRYKLRLPIFGPLFMKLYVARFARNFGTLIQGGVPMLQALDVVKQTSENMVVAEAVDQVIQHVERGGRLEQPLREADIFPDVVVDMVATGEEAGKLDLMLFKVGELYDGEIERTINTLAASLQPILIVVLGIMTAFVAAAMFWPYFRLANFLGTSF
jgi:type IV pilus assembly protein PilC